MDDSSAEAAWRRVPFGKGGPGGGIEGQCRYAMALMYGGQHGEADRLLTEIKRKAPLDARIPWLRGGNRLLAGELSGEAWAHVRQVRRLIHRFPQPVWDGSPMPERTLLVHDSNSGYGDTFQIARFVAAAKRQFQGTVMFGIMPGLPRLFTTLDGPDGLLEHPLKPEGFDYQCPLDLLPALPGCELTPQTVWTGRYLHAEPALVETWRPTFQDRHIKHIGFYWAADASHFTGKVRSIPLASLAPLFTAYGTRWYSLQRGGSAELTAYPRVTDLGTIDGADRFVQTAAVMAHLDLLIGPDSAVGHLAGALQRPTWLLLDFPCDPRWRMEGEQTPWYPAHRLFQQPSFEEWESVIAVVREELDIWLGR